MVLSTGIVSLESNKTDFLVYILVIKTKKSLTSGCILNLTDKVFVKTIFVSKVIENISYPNIV